MTIDYKEYSKPAADLYNAKYKHLDLRSFAFGFKEGVDWLLNKINNQTDESMKENNSHYFY